MGKSRIPEQAERVFKGVIFDVYHWEQELFDGSTATFEMLRRPASVAVLPVIDGKILMNREEQPGRGMFLSLPAGRVDPGESPREAAIRELLEETGYEAGQLEEFFEFNATPKIDWPVHYFIAKDCRFKGKEHSEAGEKIENYFVSFERLFEEVEQEAFRDTILKNHLFRVGNDSKKRESFYHRLFD